MPERLRDATAVFAAAVLGLAVFLVYCGWQVLLPTNIAWLNVADRAMHTLGWMYFRAAPWGVPPGASPDLGIELSNSIALVDGLPLFALPFKLLSPLLPHPFQYWGYWYLTSFVLQGVFAWLFARELGAGRAVAVLAAGFALITPAFLFRVPMHMALSGHFVILAALWLYARRIAPPAWAWPLLAAATAAIHAYLLVMVLGLWTAALVQRLWLGRLRWLGAAVEVVAVLAGSLAVMWVGGFFYTGSLGTYGYGMYKLNLLWPFISYGWSQVVPDIAHTKYDYEGLSFLGIGVFALLALGLVTGAVLRLRHAVRPAWLPLTLVLLAMMVFAFSPEIVFADRTVLTVPLPGFALDFGSLLRSTGRFVWPLLYLVTVGAVVLAAARLPARLAVPLCLVALGAQAVDSAPKWRFASDMPKPADTWTTPLVSPFWDRAAAAGYTRVRAIPFRGMGGDWQALGYYAFTHGMDIDAVYLGRIDQQALDALTARESSALPLGRLEERTIYELDDKSARIAAAHLASDDLLATIDKRIVYARHGASLVDGLGIPPQQAASH